MPEFNIQLSERKQLHLLTLCTFSGFSDSGFSKSGGHPSSIASVNTDSEPELILFK